MMASEGQKACLQQNHHAERKEEDQVEVVVSSLGEDQAGHHMAA